MKILNERRERNDSVYLSIAMHERRPRHCYRRKFLQAERVGYARKRDFANGSVLEEYYLTQKISKTQNQKIYGELIGTGRIVTLNAFDNRGFITVLGDGKFDTQDEGRAIADADGNLYLTSNRKDFAVKELKIAFCIFPIYSKKVFPA